MLRGKLVLKLTTLVVAIGLGGVFIAYARAVQPPAHSPNRNHNRAATATASE